MTTSTRKSQGQYEALQHHCQQGRRRQIEWFGDRWRDPDVWGLRKPIDHEPSWYQDIQMHVSTSVVSFWHSGIYLFFSIPLLVHELWRYSTNFNNKKHSQFLVALIFQLKRGLTQAQWHCVHLWLLAQGTEDGTMLYQTINLLYRQTHSKWPR